MGLNTKARKRNTALEVLHPTMSPDERAHIAKRSRLVKVRKKCLILAAPDGTVIGSVRYLPCNNGQLGLAITLRPGAVIEQHENEAERHVTLVSTTLRRQKKKKTAPAAVPTA